MMISSKLFRVGATMLFLTAVLVIVVKTGPQGSSEVDAKAFNANEEQPVVPGDRSNNGGAATDISREVRDSLRRQSSVARLREERNRIRLDPDDPSTWADLDPGRVESSGPRLDPDDPASWPDSSSGGQSNVGEILDPDDPGSWNMASDQPEDLGPTLDADDPSNWFGIDRVPPGNSGEPMDADDPASWPDSVR